MDFFKFAGLGMALFLIQLVQGSESDTTWLYGAKMTLANGIAVYDTASTPSIMVNEADSGTVYDGSYINFDYHFDAAASALFGPGYAGFRMVWDYGNTWMPQENVAGCDSLVFACKGLLPTHKATVYIASSGGCALPVILWKIGTIKSSADWKKTTLALPSKTIVDSIARAGLCEIRFSINDSVPTTLTSGNGNFKVDNIALVKSTAGIKLAGIVAKTTLERGYFIPNANGAVDLSMYSPKGELLFRKKIGVSAGKTYSVNQFVRAHSSLPASRTMFVKIRGAGVDFTGKDN